MARFTHPSGSPYRQVHSAAMLQLLGVTKLPVEGMLSRKIQGITVWVRALPPRPADRRTKRSTHRVRCLCPDCGVELSAGRLFQHKCKPGKTKALEQARQSLGFAARPEIGGPTSERISYTDLTQGDDE
jgi:hypothetical protein